MFTILIILHVLVALVLMMVVLLQSGKAGDLASTFGGATSQTAFGARSATTVLTKVTVVCAVIFMATSLSLAIFYSKQRESTVMDTVPYGEVSPGAVPEQEQPASETEQPVNPEEQPSESPEESKPPAGQ